MAKAIALVERIDPLVCRQTAIERFSADRMVYEYLTLYERLLEQNEVALNTAQERSDWQPGTFHNF
ncbi:MAG: hypothetical protein JOZ80_18420 [Acidobacteriaceae bacterium]|nr:hypothetical protein [Acidobacteriaceae bacterium]